MSDGTSARSSVTEARHESHDETRVVYFTSDFLGSATIAQAVASFRTQLVAIVVSKRRRSLKALWRMLRRCGAPYMCYLVAIGVAHRVAQPVCRRFALSQTGRTVLDDLVTVARRRSIPVFFLEHPSRSGNVRERLVALEPDILCSVFFDQRLPSDWLSIAKLASINVHNSLLPKYAGCAPTIAALASGDRQVGVTIHAMTDQFDAGDVIDQRGISIERDRIVLDIERKLMLLAIEMLRERLGSNARQPWTRVKQDTNQRTYQSHPPKETVRLVRNAGFRLWTLGAYLRALLPS